MKQGYKDRVGSSNVLVVHGTGSHALQGWPLQPPPARTSTSTVTVATASSRTFSGAGPFQMQLATELKHCCWSLGSLSKSAPPSSCTCVQK